MQNDLLFFFFEDGAKNHIYTKDHMDFSKNGEGDFELACFLALNFSQSLVFEMNRMNPSDLTSDHVAENQKADLLDQMKSDKGSNPMDSEGIKEQEEDFQIHSPFEDAFEEDENDGPLIEGTGCAMPLEDLSIGHSRRASIISYSRLPSTKRKLTGSIRCLSDSSLTIFAPEDDEKENFNPADPKAYFSLSGQHYKLKRRKTVSEPHFQIDSIPRLFGKDGCCHVISPSTYVSEFITNPDNDHLIFDCRSPEEFNGGHIQGAHSVSNFQLLRERFIEGLKSDKKLAIVFYCEFSCYRAPRMWHIFRQMDRNNSVGLSLHYPDVYVLQGGYSNFFQHHQEYCKGSYTPMKLVQGHEQLLDLFTDEYQSIKGQK